MPTEGKDPEIHMIWNILKDKQTSAHVQNPFLKIYSNLKIQILKISPKFKKKIFNKSNQISNHIQETI